MLLIPLLFLSCNDDFETDGIHFGIKNKNINVKLLKGVNALNVYNKLVLESKKNTSFDISQGKLKVTKGNRYSRNNQDLIIDYSQVLQVIDTLGKSNYTFRIINHPEDDEDTFHNLVYNFESEESTKINLLKYNGITPSFNTTGNASVTSVSLTDDIDCNPSEIPLPIWNPTPGGSDSPVGLPGGTIENPDNGANPNPGSS